MTNTSLHPLALCPRSFSLPFIALFVPLTLSLHAAEREASKGESCLFLGHSFFCPVVRHLPDHTEPLGLEAHEQMIVFHGGKSGSPGLMWKSPKNDISRAKAWLQTGEVDLVAMTFHSDGESRFEDYQLWVALALEHNPDTRFLIQSTWPFKRDRTLAEFEAFALEIEKSVLTIRDQLREAYPGKKFGCVPQGRWMVELWRLHEGGKLPELTGLMPEAKAKDPSCLFRDHLGHGGELALKEGVLLWLAAIYSVDLGEYEYEAACEADVKKLASSILESHPVW